MDTIKKRGLDKLIDINKFNNIISLLPNYNSVDLLSTIDELNNDRLSSLYNDITNYINNFNKANNNVMIKNVFLFNEDNNKTLLFVFEGTLDNNRIICQTDYETWNSVIDKWNSSKYPYRRWIDTFISDDKFSRLMDEYKIFISNGKIEFIDRLYKFPDLRLAYRDKKYDDKIGTLDLETLTVNNTSIEEGAIEDEYGVGKQQVYAGGWALNNLGSRMFIINNSNIYNGNDIIRVMFEELFKLKVKGYTLYAHNLGRFDSIFLIKELAELKYVVSPTWKDNAILKIKVFDPKSKQTVTLLDSINLFNTSLKKLLISFECQINKGQFPHLFVTRDNLNYIGNKPDIKYYGNISLKDYKAIPIPIQWSLKDECLKYLEKDVLGLLEVLNKMSNYYYDEFEVNITRYMTLPSLSMSIFGFNFYDEKYPIKMIKGPLEKFIREAYFGGNVGAFTQSTKGKVGKSYHYDMNSQYPAAMLNKMPTGDPVFSTNTNLSYYFGFVYALILPPSESELKNLYIQYRSDNGKVSCPRTPFYRWIPTFELESALKDNYKTEILCGINFPNALEIDSENLFKDYVDHFYNMKVNAKDSVERSIAKLMLNSLYGKFGQKDIESKIRLISRKDAEDIVKKYHISYFADINEDLVLIKYSSKLNEKLRRIYSEEDKINNDDTGFKKERGIVSAVQISCAISAYARMSINKFKNNNSNILFYSDTDSLVLEKPLNNIIVGNGLGMWKLEAVIEKGYFIRPKLYAYYTMDGILKKVASGVDSNQLSFSDYEELVNGNSVTTKKLKMSVNWEELEIKTFNQEITLKFNGVNKID